ncbi:diaminopropionate ammonia-lyase [Lactobacillus taiwanensis]|uniref:diaminopropionate ammonia-lyase n=1 Tax=Lactobacillus taiwanensis TaxID=508451 RepID=UPI0021C443F0|nr:diaminopropionate ammonia-lyase [Lactobacillus taiwanensis]
MNSFKGAGALYAMACCIVEKASLDVDKITYNEMMKPEVKEIAKKITFYTATDGNHGRGIAWAASKLGTHAVIKMPRSSKEIRADHIRKIQNTEVEITDKNYDNTVQEVKESCEKDPNGIMIQDTAWDGHEKTPGWIVKGYSLIVDEFLHQMKEKSTHIFLQAGVGSLAAGIILGLEERMKPEELPIITIVEPETVACYYLSAQKADGKHHHLESLTKTMMAGFNCQTPSVTAWPVIRDSAKFYGTLSEDVDAQGMARLGHLVAGDPKVIAGESGATGFAYVYEILSSPDLENYRKELSLDGNSRIIVLSTEGDTDPDNYREVVDENNPF